MDSELLKILLGGGGGAGVVYVVIDYFKHRRKERVLDEDTALSRLRDDYERKEREAAKAWRLVQWFRYHYPMLWHAYMQTPDAEKDRFPPTPPPEIDN
jgi:hypothetical protein